MKYRNGCTAGNPASGVIRIAECPTRRNVPSGSCLHGRVGLHLGHHGCLCVVPPFWLEISTLRMLFSGPMFGAPVVDKEHAYFIWVSDFSSQVLPPNKNFNYLALVPEGEGTIYFTTRPDLRDWSDWTKRDTWGEPVAKFIRKAGLFQSADGGATGGMTSTAQLVSSHTFSIFQTSFNFADLIPHGMTCFETGVGDEYGEAEAGTCTAVGGTL